MQKEWQHVNMLHMRKLTPFLLLASLGFLLASVFLIVANTNPILSLKKSLTQLANPLSFFSSFNKPLPKPAPKITTSYVSPYATSTTSTTTATSSTSTEEIDISNWRIFYKKTTAKDVGAYTLKFPENWGVVSNDDDDEVIFSYLDGGKIYTFVFTNKDVFPAFTKTDELQKSTTTLAQKDYFVTEYIQNGTTTLIMFEPDFIPSPFKRAVATLPPSKSSEYVSIVQTMLSTLEIEPALQPFTVKYLFVRPSIIQPKTKTALPSLGEIRWVLSNLSQEAKEAVNIKVTVEDKEGNVLLQLPNIYSPKESKITFKLPPLCEVARENETCLKRENVKFMQPYYVVFDGFICKAISQTKNCPEMLRVYAKKARSNPFSISDNKEFVNPKITVRAYNPDEWIYLIEASVTGRGNPDEKFVLVFDDGEYQILPLYEGLKFKGEWFKSYKPGEFHDFTLIRVSSAIVNAGFYGARTEGEVIGLGEVIYKKRIKIE